MGTRNPKTRHTNQLYLDEIPALRRALLGDPSARAAYDAELAVAQVAEREQKLDELQRRVRLRAAKGGLERHRPRPCSATRRPGSGLTEDVLDRLTRPIPVLIETAGRDGDDEPTSIRRPTSSTRRPAGRSAWRSSTWAAATSTTPSGSPATPRRRRSRPGPTRNASGG